MTAFAEIGNDVAQLTDSEGDDRFYGYPTYAALRGDGFLNVAKGFDNVDAEASGGLDRAYLFDSSAADTIFARSSFARIESQNRRQRVDGFDYVIAIGNNGGQNDLDVDLIDWVLIKRGSWNTP